ncbi:MAG: energy transducer TonB [Syntrophobacteraceae bacterium]
MEDTVDLLDSITMTSPWEEAGHSVPASFLALELTADGPTPLPANKIVVGDLILGIGGALLAHLVVAAAVLFLPFLQPLRNVQGSFINVYLANGAQLGCNSRGDDFSDGGDGARHFAESSPDAKTCGITVAPDVPKTAKASGPVVPRAKGRKTAALPAKTGTTSTPKTSAADPADFTAVAGAPVSQNVGADLSREQARGAGNGGETGAGAGVSGPGRSSFGTGPPGEYDAAVVDQVPKILKKIEPAYPSRARNLGIGGKVLVRFLVEPDGRVSRPSIVEAHPSGFFEQSALDAIRHWRFKPGCFKGRVVSTWVTLPFQFRLIEQD